MPKLATPSSAESAPRCVNIKRLSWFAAAVLGILLASILIAPHFVDLGLFKRTYLPLLEESLNRRIDVDEVHLALVPTPAIQLSKLSVSDSAAFAENTF